MWKDFRTTLIVVAAKESDQTLTSSDARKRETVARSIGAESIRTHFTVCFGIESHYCNLPSRVEMLLCSVFTVSNTCRQRGAGWGSTAPSIYHHTTMPDTYFDLPASHAALSI